MTHLFFNTNNRVESRYMPFSSLIGAFWSKKRGRGHLEKKFSLSFSKKNFQNFLNSRKSTKGGGIWRNTTWELFFMRHVLGRNFEALSKKIKLSFLNAFWTKLNLQIFRYYLKKFFSKNFRWASKWRVSEIKTKFSDLLLCAKSSNKIYRILLYTYFGAYIKNF